ncbi:hypothetical protein WA158_002479 [Blastocystis sp. Blastoise]
MTSNTIDMLKISWHINLLQLAVAAAGSYRVAYHTLGYAALNILMSMTITPTRKPKRITYLMGFLSFIYSLLIIAGYILSTYTDWNLDQYGFLKITSSQDFFSNVFCDVIVLLCSIILLITERSKNRCKDNSMVPRDMTSIIFITLPVSFLIDPTILNMFLLIIWVAIFAKWSHTSLNDRYYISNTTLATTNILLIIYYAIIVLNWSYPVIFESVPDNIRQLLGINNFKGMTYLPTQQILSYLCTMFSLFFSMSRVGPRGALERIKNQKKRQLLIKDEEEQYEVNKKWKNFIYSLQKFIYFFICSPWGFAIYYFIIYCWILLLPNILTPFSLLFILIDLFTIYSPRGVTKKYQKFGIAVNKDKDIEVKATKRDLLLIPNKVVRDILLSWFVLLLFLNNLISSPGFEILSTDIFQAYIWRGGNNTDFLKFATFYQFLIVTFMGICNKFTCMSYTYYLYSTKASIPTVSTSTDTATTTPNNTSSPNISTSLLNPSITANNTIPDPLLTTSSSSSSPCSPSNNNTIPKEDSIDSPSQINRNQTINTNNDTNKSIDNENNRGNSLYSTDPFAASPRTPKESTIPVEKSKKITEKTPLLPILKEIQEKQKKNRKSIAEVLLSIYYYINIIMVIGFIISLLWSVDILMGIEIIMVIISINTNKWGICLVYNALFLVVRLVFGITMDVTPTDAERWFEAFGLYGHIHEDVITGVTFTDSTILIPCIIMLINGIIYMITYYDFYNNEATKKDKFAVVKDTPFMTLCKNNWVWLLYIYLMILVFSQPPNILTLITLTFFIVLCTRHLYSKESAILWRVISVIEILIFIFQYVLLFQEVQTLFISWYTSTSMSQYISIYEIGIYIPQLSLEKEIASGGVFMYLFPTFVFTLLCYYRSSYVKQKVQLDEDKKRHPEKYIQPPVEHGETMKRFILLWNWICYLLYLHMPKITMIIVTVIIVSKQSVLTGVLLLMLIIHMYVGKATLPRWRNNHYIFCLYSTISYVIIYIYQFDFFGKLLDEAGTNSVTATILRMIGLTHHNIDIPTYTPSVFSPMWNNIFVALYTLMSEHMYIFITCCIQYICINKGDKMFNRKCKPPTPDFSFFGYSSVSNSTKLAESLKTTKTYSPIGNNLGKIEEEEEEEERDTQSIRSPSDIPVLLSHSRQTSELFLSQSSLLKQSESDSVQAVATPSSPAYDYSSMSPRVSKSPINIDINAPKETEGEEEEGDYINEDYIPSSANTPMLRKRRNNRGNKEASTPNKSITISVNGLGDRDGSQSLPTGHSHKSKNSISHTSSPIISVPLSSTKISDHIELTAMNESDSHGNVANEFTFDNLTAADEMNNNDDQLSSSRGDVIVSKENNDSSSGSVSTPVSIYSESTTKYKWTDRVYMVWLGFLDVILSIISIGYEFINENVEVCVSVVGLIVQSVSCGSDNIISIINCFCLWFMTPSLKPSLSPAIISGVYVVIIIFMFAMLVWTERETWELNDYLASHISPYAPHYFFLKDVTSSYIFINTVNFFFCVLLYQIKKEIYGYNKIGDDYINKNNKTIWETICAFVVCNITRIIQIFIFLVSSSNASLLSSVYFLFSIYYMIKPDKLRQVGNRPLMNLRIFALVHLFMLVIYQFPFFNPVESDDSFPFLSFLGLHKFVMTSYNNNPVCYEFHLTRSPRGTTYCPSPMEIDGILFLSLITALMQILDIVQKRPSYKCALKYFDEQEKMESSNKLLIATTISSYYDELKSNLIETRLYVNKKVNLILEQVTRIQQEMFKKTNSSVLSLSPPPMEMQAFPTSPYSARVMILGHMENNALDNYNIQSSLLGFIVSWESQPRNTLLPHSDGEVFVKPERDENGYSYIDITTLLPETQYQFQVYSLYENGRSAPITCPNDVITPSYSTEMLPIQTKCFISIVGEVYKKGVFKRGSISIDYNKRIMKVILKSGTESEYDLRKVVRCTKSKGVKSIHDSIDMAFITPWSSYTYIRIKEDKDMNIVQIQDMFNRVLPFPVKDEPMFEIANDDDKSSIYSSNTAKLTLLQRFKQWLNTFNKWEILSYSQYIYLIILIIYTAARNDIFSWFLLIYTYCFAILDSIHITKEYYIVVLWANAFWLVLKFIIQTPLVCQCVTNSVWTLNISPLCGSYTLDSESLSYNPLYMIGLYKTDNVYHPPFMGDFIYDLILFIYICFHMGLLKKYGLWGDSISKLVTLSEETVESNNVESIFTFINKESYEALPAVKLYKKSIPSIKSKLLELVPDVYEWKYKKSHPYKFGENLYFHELILQLVTLVYALLLHSKMTAKDYSQFTNDITTDQLEFSTLIFIIIYFFAIIWNRQIFIKRDMFMKIIYHCLYCVIMFTYLIFVVPVISQKDFINNWLLIIFYIFQVYYIQISANQIRKGYPTVDKNIKDMLNESYTMIPRYINVAYTSIPFLFELSEYISWSFTTTSLNRYDWMMVQQIKTTLFNIKCRNDAFNKDACKQQSLPRPTSDKWINGILYVFVLCLILLLPLILFSNGSPALAPNPVIMASAKISIVSANSIVPIYTSEDLATFADVSEQQYNEWKKQFPGDKNSTSLLPSEWSSMGQTITLPISSFNTWTVSDKSHLLML